jgi:putative aldouronate transport system permease protein
MVKGLVIHKKFVKFNGYKVCDILIHMLLIIFILIIVLPFVHLIALSFNEGTDALRGGIIFWPRKFTLENYKIIFQENSLLHATLISVLRTVIGTSSSLFITAAIAYCFTKNNLVGKKLYMIIFLLPMYIGIGLIPTFLTYRMLHLTNNFAVYIIPNLAWAYNIIIMRTFFEGLPGSLEESAFLDGANEFTVFLKVIMPLSKPVIVTICLFNGVWQWNSWFDTVMYIRGNSLDTLSSLLAHMLMEQQSNFINDMKLAKRAVSLTPAVLKAAMTMVTVIPVMLIFPSLQKYFVKGIMVGAVKG